MAFCHVFNVFEFPYVLIMHQKENYNNNITKTIISFFKVRPTFWLGHNHGSPWPTYQHPNSLSSRKLHPLDHHDLFLSPPWPSRGTNLSRQKLNKKLYDFSNWKPYLFLIKRQYKKLKILARQNLSKYYIYGKLNFLF